MSTTDLPSGLKILPGFLDASYQKHLVEIIRSIVKRAPLVRPTMPKSGKPFSVRMTNCGSLGWVSDKGGYRYQPSHPVTGQPWPILPEELLQIWKKTAEFPELPEACLINFYDAQAKMGLHRDEDEEEFSAPVVSISLGDACLFRIGGLKRSDPTRSFRLSSGDLLILGNGARLCYHGVDRIFPGTSSLLKDVGRINVTLRRVTRVPGQDSAEDVFSCPPSEAPSDRRK